MIVLIATLALHLPKMSLEEKIGQLFVAPLAPDHGPEHLKRLLELIETHHVGGVILKQGTPALSVESLNIIDQGKIPLLCYGDAEWGVSMRLREAVKYPRSLTLGAIPDLSLLEKFGRQVGKECRAVGIHINFAPVFDVNTNPLNPIIGTRSFGDRFDEVALRANAAARGMQQEGIFAAAKHFPGHGDTFVDSHIDLPTIDHLHLSPFLEAVRNGVGCIMTAHLYYRPFSEIATFCPRLVRGILRDEWKFDGLIVTDALNMGALYKNYTVEQIAVSAVKAGHDVLLFGSHLIDVVDSLIAKDIPLAAKAIKEAVLAGEISLEELDERVLRILEAKEKLCVRPLVKPQDLCTKEALSLKRELFRQAATIAGSSLSPLEEGASFRLVQFGKGQILEKTLSRYGTNSPSEGPVIVAVYDAFNEARAFMDRLEEEGTFYIPALFASPYKLPSLGSRPAVLVLYENDPDAEEAAADVIFGKLAALGKLPICP